MVFSRIISHESLATSYQSPVTTLSTARRLLLAAASGLLLFAAFPPWQWHWLAWIAPWPLLVAVLGASPRVAALCGLVHSASFCGLSVYWIFTIFHSYGQLPLLAAAGVFALLILYISLYRIAFCAALAWVSRSSHARACLLAPFLWVAAEFALVRTPNFSLPWNLLGYSAANQLGVVQLATVAGVHGLSFLMVTYSALLARLAHDRTAGAEGFPATKVFFGMTALLLAAQVMGPRLVPVAQARYVARLVQPNFEMEGSADSLGQKMAAELDEIERLSVSGAHTQPFVIWPEVPRPFYLQDPVFAARTQRIAQANGGKFLVGVVEWRPAPDPASASAPERLRPRNSAVLLGAAGERLYTYDKIHLVPFGEYVPLQEWFRFADALVAEVGRFVPGSERRMGKLTGGKFATVICFEVVFPNDVREFVAGGAELLVNISNDGWLGRTGGRVQHLDMARMRAVENRRWLLRATNNGYTVAVDPYGRVVAGIAPDQRAALDAPYDFRSDVTLYARWGDWFAWLCVLVSGTVILLEGRKQGSKDVRKPG